MVLKSTGATRPSRLSSRFALVGYIVLVRVLLYLLAATHYGYFRDELYYLACGEHPAWGYVDQPPMIGWIAWLLQHTIGTSLWAIRLLPLLADVGAIAVTANLAQKLGGRRWAMFFAALAVLVTPIFLSFSHLFTMNAFDPLLWTLLTWLMVHLIQTGNQKLWLWIGALVGITLLNKYGVLFLIVGLLAGVILSPLRRSLGRPWFWAGIALATVIALPNFLWQWHWHFPFIQMVRGFRQHGRDVMLPPLPYLAQQAQMISFIPVLLVILGVGFAFSPVGRRYAIVACGFLSTLGLMLFLKGKFYYVAPAYPAIFAAGAVFLEQLTERRRLRWFRPVYALVMAVVGGLIAPTALPFVSVKKYIAYTKTLGIQQQKFENEPESELPQIYSDMFGWEERVRVVAAYYHSLSPEEQRVTAIGAPNYGEAGAIDLFGPKYGLPKAISDSNNYWIWGPRDYTGQSVLLLDETSPQNYTSQCQSLREVAHPIVPYSRPDENFPIYHCRGLSTSLKVLWPTLKPWR
jgi:hypothetical protein